MIEYYDNIMKYWNMATENEIEQGFEWYTKANKFAHRLAARYDVAFDLVARVIAVISPLVSWERNKTTAEYILKNWTKGERKFDTHGFNKNIEKAYDILDGDLDRLSGPKVTRFYENIKYANIDGSVTVDKHTYRVAVDDPDVPYNDYIPPKTIDEIITAYQKVAKTQGLLPHQVQAVTWLVLKRVRPTWQGDERKF